MKLIDWSKLPRGTMTNKGEIIGIHKEGREALIFDGNMAFWKETEFLRIVQATRWTYHDGGECQIPYGVICEAMWGEITRPAYETIRGAHSWDKIIAYRITGVDRAGGWTDCHYEATE